MSAWTKHLENFPDKHLADVVRTLQSTTGLPDPLRAGPLENDPGFELLWESDNFVLSLEVLSAGTYGWFFSDRASGVFGGSDDESTPVTVLPEILKAAINQLKWPKET